LQKCFETRLGTGFASFKSKKSVLQKCFATRLGTALPLANST
jgi:hypothetical protein